MKRPSASEILVAVLLSTTAGKAYADHQVGIAVTGEATIQPQLANQLELWITRTGHKVLPSPLEPDAINAIIDCFVIDDEACARSVFEKRSKAATVVYARADVQAGSTAMERDVTVTTYWFQKGSALIQKKKRCEHCNEEKLRATADELVGELLQATGKIGHLKCTSDPVGAEVTVGNRKIGVTPLDQPLAPGNYKIVVTHVRHGVEARDVTVVAGQTVNLDLALRVHGGGGGGTRSRALPALVMTAGVLTLATGVAMFAIDEDSSASPDAGRFIRNTGPTGVGLATVGLAVTVGGYVWFRATGRRQDSPVASVTRDGTVVGWLRRF